MASPESWCAGNGAVGSNPTPSAGSRPEDPGSRPEVPGPRRPAPFAVPDADRLGPVTPSGLFGAPTPPELPAEPAPEKAAPPAPEPPATPEGPAADAAPDTVVPEPASAAAPDPTPTDAGPEPGPADAVPAPAPAAAAPEPAPAAAAPEPAPGAVDPEPAPAAAAPEPTPPDAGPEPAGANAAPEATPEDGESAVEPVPATPGSPTTPTTTPATTSERSAARTDDAGAGDSAADPPVAAREATVPASESDPVPPTPEDPPPEGASAAGPRANPEPEPETTAPTPDAPSTETAPPAEPASAGAPPKSPPEGETVPEPTRAAPDGDAAEVEGEADGRNGGGNDAGNDAGNDEGNDGKNGGGETEGDEYEVLALRYRPQTFSDLIGQEPIARTLQNAIRRDRVSHAFLFSGQRGIGKTTTARILAKALNCSATDGPNPEPCGGCPSCREIAGGFSRDVPEIDGASNNSVEKAREIIETAHYTPVRDRFKIYLVDEVHMLSTGAFNALLKTLEEPPKHVKFIFATTEVHKIPDTILSRCQEFEFRAVTPERVQERLRFIVEGQGFAVSDEALAQIARFGQGSMRDAISALDQVLAAVDGEVTATEVSELLGVPDVAICRRAAAAILEGDRRAVFEVVADLVSGGRDLKHFVTLFMHYLRDVVVCRAAPDRPALLEWPDERTALADFAEKFSEEDLLRSLDVLTRAQDGLRWSPEPRFHLEMALLKLVEMPRLAAFETLLDRIENAPASGGAAGGAGPTAPSPAESAPPPSPGPPPTGAGPPAGARATSRPARGTGALPSANGAGPRVPPGANGAAPPPPAGELPPAEVPEIVKEYQRAFGGQILPTPRTETRSPETPSPARSAGA